MSLKNLSAENTLIYILSTMEYGLLCASVKQFFFAPAKLVMILYILFSVLYYHYKYFFTAEKIGEEAPAKVSENAWSCVSASVRF